MTTDQAQFRSLRWRLLLSFLGVMAAILGISAIAVYQLFARSLYEQLDDRLMTLAEAAAQSITDVKEEYQEHYLGIRHGDEPNDPDGSESTAQTEPTDIPWQNFRAPQGAEWFDEHGQPLIKSGGLFLSTRTVEKRSLAIPHTVGHIRTLTIAVYGDRYQNHQAQIQGYVRINESIQPIEVVLEHLQWGLGIGGLVALGLTAAGGMWLTRQSLQPIEQNFQQLKQFTADASHELRTPLTAIKTSVEVMQSHPERIHPADVKKLDAIASATRQMTHLAEDLLLLTRLDTAQTSIHQRWLAIPLNELLQELVDNCELQAQIKGIILQADLADVGSVMGDSSQLTRLFTNLIQNALQYTSTGGHIRVTLSRSDRCAIVRIEDTGIGIAAEDLPFVFDRFWRADRARSHREGGLGLGLAIAQRIAQSSGGTISVSSQLGKGTCFQVRLPAIAKLD